MGYSIVVLASILALAGSAHADVYRWVDEKGAVHYSDALPPATAKSQSALHVVPKGGLVESSKEVSVKSAALAGNPRVTEPPPGAATLPRGLDFRKYLSIRPGMAEGELLAVAGEADRVADQGFARSLPTALQADRSVRRTGRAAMAIRTYTYLPTRADPYVTTVSLVGGRVSEIERVRTP